MLVLTVISCSCFALPTAIIGLVFATKVERQYHQGFQREANSSANTAKILFIVSACLLVFSFIIGIGMNILGMILEN
ncbi:MAG: CD225/dispanin family protein [Saprospiraceae bacterium]